MPDRACYQNHVICKKDERADPLIWVVFFTSMKYRKSTEVVQIWYRRSTEKVQIRYRKGTDKNQLEIFEMPARRVKS